VQIANRENLEFEEDALKLAAKAARGSVRDALQNLQSVIAYAGNSEKLTYEAARDILGVSDERLYFLLIESIAKVDVPKGMQIINKLLIDGREAKQITEGIEWHLRNLMIMLTCSKDLEPFGFLEDEVKRYKHQAASLTEKGTKVQLVLDWLSSLHDVNKGLIVNLDPQVLLETFVVKAIISKKRLEN
jgi:DNA polymerase-3 subunit gamma/tau